MSRSVNYNNIAPDFDRRYRENDYGGIERALLNFIGANFSVRILEVGCGTGHWLEMLSNWGYQPYGLDTSPGMLAGARNKLSGTLLIQGTAEALPFPDEFLDRVFCINAFHHFPNPERFIAEVRRVLRHPGGLFTIGLDPHNGLNKWWVYDYFPQTLETDMQRYLPTAQIRKLMREKGFTDCFTVEALHMPKQVFARTALENGSLGKGTTSQLTLLTDDEYNRGINKLYADIEAAESRGETLIIGGDLRLYATIGWIR